jgi:hypothetical protein
MFTISNRDAEIVSCVLFSFDEMKEQRKKLNIKSEEEKGRERE